MAARDRRRARSLISLFSGAGGLDLGMEMSGHFKTKVAIESQEIFCETLRINAATGSLSELKVIEADVTTLSPKDIVEEYFSSRDVDGLVGGPPCQSFSTMGKELGTNDSRGKLIFDFARWAVELPIRFFLLENVPQLATVDGGRVCASLRKYFEEEGGFSVTQKIVNCADYGAATRRKRLFMVGVRNAAPFQFPDPTHTKEPLPLAPKEHRHVTAGEAFAGLPEPTTEPPGLVADHWAVNHTDDVRDQFSKVEPGTYYRRRRRSRLALDQPAPSLVAGDLRGIRSHIHPSVHRELTNRESARIHGFPDDYIFAGNHAAVGLQIANSVPIPVSGVIANALYRQLFRN